MDMTTTFLPKLVCTINSGHWRHFYSLAFEIPLFCVIWELLIELVIFIGRQLKHIVVMRKGLYTDS